MKVNRKVFTQAVNDISRVIEPRSSLPVLETLLIEPNQPQTGYVKLSGTDLDVGMVQWVEAALDPEDIRLVINAKVLKKTLKVLPKAVTELDVVLRAEAVTVNGVRIATPFGPDDFPSVNSGTDPAALAAHRVPGLIPAFARVLLAISHDESRHTINGVLVNLRDGDVVTTDGHRLHRATIPAEQGSTPDIIIPRKAVEVLVDVQKRAGGGFILRGPDGTIQMGAMSAPKRRSRSWRIPQPPAEPEVPAAAVLVAVPISATFELERGFLVTRLIEGQFPNYQAVIPRFSDTRPFVTMTFPKVGLEAALRQAMVIADQRSHGIALIPKAGQIVVWAEHEGNKTTAPVDGSTIELHDLAPDPVAEAREERKPLTLKDAAIGFNAQYLLDALEPVDGETVTLRFKDRFCPGLITSDGFTAVVMPMRISAPDFDAQDAESVEPKAVETRSTDEEDPRPDFHLPEPPEEEENAA